MKQSYNNKFDAWSIGIIIYILITGKFPFQGRNSYATAKMIKTSELNFNGEEFEDISNQCKDLISKLLDKNPQTRLNVQDSFDHAWFKSMKSASAKKINSTLQIKREGDINIMNNLKSYKKECSLLKAIKLFTIKFEYEGDEIS